MIKINIVAIHYNSEPSVISIQLTGIKDNQLRKIQTLSRKNHAIASKTVGDGGERDFFFRKPANAPCMDALGFLNDLHSSELISTKYREALSEPLAAASNEANLKNAAMTPLGVIARLRPDGWIDYPDDGPGGSGRPRGPGGRSA